LEEKNKMDLLEQRLNELWLRKTTPSNHLEPEPEPEPLTHVMGVTFREPVTISGAMLMPGRYLFQLPDPRVRPHHVEIFNEDQTKLVANVLLGGRHLSDGYWEAIAA
jgi:hypothetical protein